MKASGNNKDMKKHAISLYVANKPGVLIRISLIFARRGFNIDSLVVSEAHDPRFSHMNLVASGDAETLVQIIKQLNKLVDVVHATDHTGDNIIDRELALIKLQCAAEQRTEIMQISHVFDAVVINLTDNTMIIQSTGSTEKLDGFHKMLGKYKIIEMVRTGKVLMSRGEELTG
ncbi:MAG: acetolactate synthase small subunit [Spirochaetales bacterium]|nr:acetolactate synthase small subunit [Spirochaetales bacterium]